MMDKMSSLDEILNTTMTLCINVSTENVCNGDFYLAYKIGGGGGKVQISNIRSFYFIPLLY
jgi:hypothetical protein